VPLPPSGVVRFSMEMLPKRERFSAFREEFVRRVLAIDVIDHSGGWPRADLIDMSLGRLTLAPLSAGRPSSFVTKHHVKDGSDDFLFEIVETGPVQFTHAGEERIRDAGSACFFGLGRPRRGFGLCGGSVRNVTVRAAALKPLVVSPEDLAGHPVHPGPAVRLLDG
jgi:hypothetical protein